MSKETLLTFPCDFPIKIMGRNSETLEAEVTRIVRKHVQELSADAVTTRSSGEGNFLAITVIVTATSKEQLDNIYLELNAHEAVLMTL